MFAKAGYSEAESIEGKRKKFSIITNSDQLALREIRQIGALGYKNWSNEHQGKQADVVFVDDDERYYICEMKHIKEAGGAQNKQISELIALIDNQGDEQVSYVAYLDGVYFNKFISTGKSKSDQAKRQKKDIERCLNSNPSNFFLNTYGFKLLIGCDEL